MKVCTDACVFGAVVASQLRDAQHVLDIGTGTGLLSLMYAQNNRDAIIDSLDIDTDAFRQATYNVNASPWMNQISVENVSIQNFATNKRYNLIISNPPFFEKDLRSTVQGRNSAMHDTTLTLKELLEVASPLLAPNGKLAILIPWHRTDYLVDIAKTQGLYLSSLVKLKQSVHHNYFRSILYFSNAAAHTVYEDEISIKDSENNYTDRFVSLLKDYYLYL